jgi:hypothetical protein
MSAESLYDALHNTITEQMDLDDPLSSIEVIGALEMVKHDLLVEFDAALDLDPDPEPITGACCMPDQLAA